MRKGRTSLLAKTMIFTVLADKHALWHVIYNLLKNAHRYAGYDCKITLWLEEKSRRLHIKDDGEGIPRAKLSKIFEPFYTGSSVGSGIGLGMCKTIMEGLGAGHSKIITLTL